MKTKTIVFDLDDTLVKEIDYLKSAFSAIAYWIDSKNSKLYDQMWKWYLAKENVFSHLVDRYPNVSLEMLKIKYRTHQPDFQPYGYVKNYLEALKEKGFKLGLITDGFSITQRNKLKALNIEHLFDLIVISEEFGSEKPSEANYTAFHQFATDDYFYIGDNTSKDFLAPNRLGWKTICILDDGNNIHAQTFDKEAEYLPGKTVTTILAITFDNE